MLQIPPCQASTTVCQLCVPLLCPSSVPTNVHPCVKAGSALSVMLFTLPLLFSYVTGLNIENTFCFFTQPNATVLHQSPRNATTVSLHLTAIYPSHATQCNPCNSRDSPIQTACFFRRVKHLKQHSRKGVRSSHFFLPQGKRVSHATSHSRAPKGVKIKVN